MSPDALAKIKPEDTRARILETAEPLFRRLGYAKTAVADIADALAMSSANVYRFFPSKNAIVEAICQRCLSGLEEKAWAAARGRGPAARRLERLFLEILAYHKENLLVEQQLNDIILIAIELSWDAVREHKKVIHTVVEVLLRDGIAAGEFESVDPKKTATHIMQFMASYCHPMLLSQELKGHKDIEADARAAIAFLLRAITPR
jgi:AcrR family transcriptional regulator